MDYSQRIYTQMDGFPQRLRSVREALGISQASFGALGGVLQQAQFKYEKGERKPDVEYLFNLAEHNIDIQYIITGIPSNSRLSEKEVYLIKLFRNSEIALQDASIRVLGGEFIPSSNEDD